MSPKRSAVANLADAAPVFAALGDETRLRIVAQLSASGPQSIVRLTETTDVSRQAITKHLQVLCDAGFVVGERHGREHVWRLQPRCFRDVHAHLDRISREWDGALERLREFVDGEGEGEREGPT